MTTESPDGKSSFVAMLPLSAEEIRVLHDALVVDREELYTALRECEGTVNEATWRQMWTADIKTCEGLIDRLAAKGRDRHGNRLQTVKDLDYPSGN